MKFTRVTDDGLGISSRLLLLCMQVANTFITEIVVLEVPLGVVAAVAFAVVWALPWKAHQNERSTSAQRA